MLEADYGSTELAFNADNNRQFANDDKLFVHFHLQPVLDKATSKAEGRPIYVSKEFIRIIVPGDKNNIVNRPVWAQDLQRFPQQYAKFKNNQEQVLVGLPIEQVAWISREQVEELKYFNVRTLEQLANIPDMHAQKFMGINRLRTRARDHLEAAKEAAPQAALRAEIEKKDAELTDMKALIASLNNRLAKLEADEEPEVATPSPKAVAKK